MSIKIVATNKKAYHEYYIEDTFEAGIMLTGTEVKSIRAGKVNLKESFCRIKDGEVFINNMNISPYEFGNRENHDPTRIRKLLLHHAEIDKLTRLTEQKGMTMVPTKIYFKQNYVKLEIGIGRGKNLHDKRQSLKSKEADREVAKALKGSFR
ncbi:MAG TPA: SsrA-binding protein SmpB [Malonomonas sp.]